MNADHRRMRTENKHKKEGKGRQILQRNTQPIKSQEGGAFRGPENTQHFQEGGEVEDGAKAKRAGSIALGEESHMSEVMGSQK